MTISRFARGLLALGITSLLGCGAGITMTELQALNPAAATLKVPCHPWQILETVKIFAVRPSGNDIVTDETQNELRDFAQYAGAFIEVDASAPPENAQVMASQYGLICREDMVVRSTPLESLRTREPCSTKVTSSNPATANLVADVGQAPCDSSGQTKEVKKAPVRVKVCARPPWVPAPYKTPKGKWVTVDEWAIVLGNNKVEWTGDAAHYAEEIAKHADVIFTFDKSAPPESVYYFTKNPTVLHCESGLPKKSYDEVASSGNSPMLSEVTAAREAKEKAEADAKKQGHGKTTSTSSPDGKGPPLDPFETIARELVFAGKLATTDTSAPATTADGSRHGMPGGKNVGGFSFPLLQAGVGLASIAIGVGMKPQDFIKKVVEKTGLGKPAIVKELNADALRLADELIKDYGEAVMAESLWKQKLILPYGMASKFTAKLENAFQAHKIFERQAFKDVLNFEGKALKDAVDKAPAIILTKEQHKVISDALAAGWKKVGKKNMTKEKLRELYKNVYQTDPHWLEAIESYFR